MVARLAAIDGSIPGIYQDRPLSRILPSIPSSQCLSHSVFCACRSPDHHVQSARNTRHHPRLVASQIHPLLVWVVELIGSRRKHRLHPPLHQSRPTRHLFLLRHLSRLVTATTDDDGSSTPFSHLSSSFLFFHHQQHRGVGRCQSSLVRHRPHLHSQRTPSLPLLTSRLISEEPWSSSITSSSFLTFIP